jgi:cytochrome c oxidase assembly protein subunit 15
MSTLTPSADSLRWPRRLALALGVVTLALITVGGMVTTHKAGMAVEDWPGTFGWNMFAYPIDRWLFGPFQLMIEHSHRLLGSLAGLVSIALLITTLGKDIPRWVKWAAVGLLLLVIFQGLLGGLRVRLDARKVALLHGCVGPTFFACAIAFATACSKSFQNAYRESMQKEEASSRRSTFTAAAMTLLALVWAQLVLGAHLRHPLDDGSPRVFQLFVVFHILVAVAVYLQSWMVHGQAKSVTSVSPSSFNSPRGWSLMLVVLTSSQLLLGVSTWVVKYGFPPAMHWIPYAAQFQVTARDGASAAIVTGHVVVGASILAVSASLATWGGLLVAQPVASAMTSTPKKPDSSSSERSNLAMGGAA